MQVVWDADYNNVLQKIAGDFACYFYEKILLN